MNMHLMKSRCRKNNRRGAILVLIVVMLPVVIAMAAFALDLAWMHLVRTELRISTDAASRAGAMTLSLAQSEAVAREAAKEAARRNHVAGAPLDLKDAEIEFGFGEQAGSNSRFVFTPGGTRLNSVRIHGNRTSSSTGGPVALFLGQFLGVSHFQPSHTATSTQLDRDICLVVDRSGSMMRSVTGTDVPGGRCNPPHATLSRWGGLYTAVEGFINELEKTQQQEQCGLVSYSSQGTSSCGFSFTTSDINAHLNFDYTPIRNEMDEISSRAVAGMTNIGAGIDNGIVVLTSPQARAFAFKTMVVMTDGRHNTGPEPVIAARRAAREDIKIHTVTFSSQADFDRMRAVADATGGTHYHAPDSAALESIFREIAATLPVMLTE